MQKFNIYLFVQPKFKEFQLMNILNNNKYAKQASEGLTSEKTR